jgi:hypothetical protein
MRYIVKLSHKTEQQKTMLFAGTEEKCRYPFYFWLDTPERRWYRRAESPYGTSSGAHEMIAP